MKRIADGVWEIGIGYVHAHLIAVDDGLVLIDTGIAGRVERLLNAVKATGHRAEDLHTVLLTHRHPDHTGTLADLRERTGARVVAHVADAPVIRGEQPQPLHGLLMRLTAPFMRAAPAPVDVLLDGDGPSGVPGVAAVHTPGHTPGHLSYLLERDGGVLFAGDAATWMFGRVRSSPKPVTEDRVTADLSVRKLAGLDFRVAVFGHGRAVTTGAADRFRDYAARG